jgi:protein-tyrosine phosphatase
VVHCAAGVGRTSRVLAAFRTYVRGAGIEEALEQVTAVKAVYREPIEGIGEHFTRDELTSLLRPGD